MANKPASLLLCLWERHLAGFPHLGVVDRWPATVSKLVIALCTLSRKDKYATNNKKIIKNILYNNCQYLLKGWNIHQFKPLATYQKSLKKNAVEYFNFLRFTFISTFFKTIAENILNQEPI